MEIGKHVEQFQELMDRLAAERESLSQRYDGELGPRLRRWVEELTLGNGEAATRLSIELVTDLCSALEAERHQVSDLCELLARELAGTGTRAAA